jgi:hypothetical protein
MFRVLENMADRRTRPSRYVTRPDHDHLLMEPLALLESHGATFTQITEFGCQSNMCVFRDTNVL